MAKTIYFYEFFVAKFQLKEGTKQEIVHSFVFNYNVLFDYCSNNCLALKLLYKH